MVSAGNGMFTLLGFMGMYTVLGILFLFLVRREIEQGPEGEQELRPVVTGSFKAPAKMRLQPLAKKPDLEPTHRH
jgi:cytochrome bd-type quinol oxidase subunit 1